MNCKEKFISIYDRQPSDIAFCPYRICPLGAHVDHQFGIINGMAIDKGISFAYGPKKNGIVELSSLNFKKRAQFFINDVPEVKEDDWADYLRGVTKVLSDKYPLKVGICGVFEGSLPIGGLSSSAAVTIVYLTSLAKLNSIHLSQKEIIMMAKKAENEYVGVSSGKLDQSCEVYCKKDHLLVMDTLDDSYELIKTPENMKPYKIAIFFSGVERTLANSKYNLRVDECKSAAYDLLAFANMEYGKYKDVTLRDVPLNVYEKYKEALPHSFRKRAEHYYSEVERAKKGAIAWREGDIEEYGRLVSQSGYSSINNYESGSEELRTLHEIIVKQEGVYGTRFSGAGFKGCSMALVKPEYAKSIEENVQKEYLEKFPELKGKYSFHLCDSASGVEIF